MSSWWHAVVHIEPHIGKVSVLRRARKYRSLLRAQDVGVREIARLIGRSPSTASRELTRNAATRGGKLEYRASVAQWKSELVAQRPKPAKLVMNPRLRQHVQDRLERQDP